MKVENGKKGESQSYSSESSRASHRLWLDVASSASKEKAYDTRVDRVRKRGNNAKIQAFRRGSMGSEARKSERRANNEVVYRICLRPISKYPGFAIIIGAARYIR